MICYSVDSDKSWSNIDNWIENMCLVCELKFLTRFLIAYFTPFLHQVLVVKTCLPVSLNNIFT